MSYAKQNIGRLTSIAHIRPVHSHHLTIGWLCQVRARWVVAVARRATTMTVRAKTSGCWTRARSELSRSGGPKPQNSTHRAMGQVEGMKSWSGLAAWKLSLPDSEPSRCDTRATPEPLQTTCGDPTVRLHARKMPGLDGDPHRA